MPNYDWKCHACQKSNKAFDEQCAKCGCPAIATSIEIQRAAGNGTGFIKHEIVKVEPTTPLQASGLIAFGLFLLSGACYQVLAQKWFPLFPVQIDGIFAIFKTMFGVNAGIYISSILGGVMGLGSLWLGASSLRNQNG